MSKLADLRRGVTKGTVTLSGNIEVAVVIVPTSTLRQIECDIEEWCQGHPKQASQQVRKQMYDIMLIHECTRDKDNIDVKITDSWQEAETLLDNEDVSRILSRYQELMVNKAPKIELLTDEEFEKLKKLLEGTKLTDLSTVSALHLKNCLTTWQL